MSVCLSVCHSVCIGHCTSRTNARNLIKLYFQLHFNIIRCISLKTFRCCSKFFISLTQCYRTKLGAISPNEIFLPNILKFKTFIYNSNSKFIYNFCIHGTIIPRRGRSNPSPRRRHFLPLVVLETPQNAQNI